MDFLKLVVSMNDEIERCKRVGTHSIHKLTATAVLQVWLDELDDNKIKSCKIYE